MSKLTVNGISTCPQGEEKYEYFNITPRRRQMGRRCQYDYRDNDGELFSCIGHNLEQCREKRDRWLELKNVSTYKCTHYIPANYANTSTCKVGGYCTQICNNFQSK